MQDSPFFARILILDGKDKKRRPRAPLPWHKKDGGRVGGRKHLNPEASCLSTTSSRTQGSISAYVLSRFKKKKKISHVLHVQPNYWASGRQNRHGGAERAWETPVRAASVRTPPGGWHLETKATTGRTAGDIRLSFGKIKMPR